MGVCEDHLEAVGAVEVALAVEPPVATRSVEGLPAQARKNDHVLTKGNSLFANDAWQFMSCLVKVNIKFPFELLLLCDYPVLSF